MKLNFFSTIKGKLTLWYGSFLVLILFTALGLVNLYGAYFATRYDPIPAPILKELPEKLPKHEIMRLIRENRREEMINTRRISLLVFSALVIVGIGGGYILAEKLLKPIRDLNDQIKKINDLNLSDYLHESSVNDEIGELVVNFNQMLLRLNSAYQLEKEFIANVSHQLKTPLTIMSANLERINKQLKGINSTEKVTLVLEQIESINKLIDDLLLISRLEGRNFPLKEISVEKLYNRTQRECLEYTQIYQNLQLEWRFEDACADSRIQGNPDLIQVAVSNLIDNSCKYGKDEQGKINIEVVINCKNGMLTIEISDQGAGIPQDYQSKLFRRFHQSKSQSLKTGNGLGLAIAKSIAELMSGDLRYDKKYISGAKFCLSFPLV